MTEYQYRGKDTLTFQRLPGYKKIVAWQAASDLADQIDTLVKRFGPGYYRLTDQMRPAAIAIAGNIAEGYCSGSLGNYIRYSNVARGSAGELGSYIQDCERWELIKGDELQTLVKQYSLTTYFLDRLLQALKEKEGTWDRSYGVKESAAEYRTDSVNTLDNSGYGDYTDEQITGVVDN
ncbi:MAG: four helix bundle protein [Chloroflexi bacterium]|nr:four helix bundle protein [Chloroflexota bacterium]